MAQLAISVSTPLYAAQKTQATNGSGNVANRAASANRQPGLRARYAAARPNSDNARQYIDAIRFETPLQVGNSADRATLRKLARYEALNNAHAAGIARLFALYVCGVGPRLRWRGWEKCYDRPLNRKLADYVEYRWREFSTDLRFPALLRQTMQTIVVDGEAFLCLTDNPRRALRFGVELLDGQRVGNPNGKRSDSRLQDGVVLDPFGNPDAYYVFQTPENDSSFYDTTKYELMPAQQVFHLFREDYAGQTRGASWFAPALLMLQQLRAYTEATIEAAKAGARVWASVETQNGFDVDSYLDIEKEVQYDAYSSFETPNGRILMLPAGTTMRGFNPTQPTTAADAYTANLLSQIGYAMGLPRNKATGSSHEYNFASGRLDNQPFELLISTLQKDMLERDFCDRLFSVFYEAIYPELLMVSDDAPRLVDSDWEWDWPSPPLVDAEATARSNAILVKSGQRTLREVWEELHPEGDFEKAAREMERDRERFPEIYGVTNNQQTEESVEPAETPETRIREPRGQDVEVIQ